MRHFILTLCILSCITTFAQTSRIVCDDTTCKIEFTEGKTGSNGYSVVSPVGTGTVEHIRMAPRLETLAGKTIAVTGVSFMTEITHPEICSLIRKNYPDARIITIDEIGIAGVYPAPGVRRRSTEDFRARLKSLNIDAVICGNGGCGLCTPKETGSAITAEYEGIPAVVIAGDGFCDQARHTAYNNGIPALRIAKYPGAFASISY